MRDEIKRRLSSLIPRPSSLVAVLLALLTATTAAALNVPPPPAQWFTDTAGIVSAQQAQELNDKLRAFEQQQGVQFIVYTLPSLEGEAVEDFTIRCAEAWKVGNKKYDNGLILFVFVKEKKVRVEVGYGLEGTVTDAFSSRVIREQMAPHFQSGDYYGGLNAAADALIAKIRGGEQPVAPVNAPSQRQPGGSTSVGGIDPFFILIIVIIFFVFILPMLRGGRRRGGCGGCFWPMFFFPGGGTTFGGRGGGWGGGGFGGGFGGGGFSGGGGGFGGGGATGGW
jgi:uncharacterized protein